MRLRVTLTQMWNKSLSRYIYNSAAFTQGMKPILNLLFATSMKTTKELVSISEHCLQIVGSKTTSCSLRLTTLQICSSHTQVVNYLQLLEFSEKRKLTHLAQLSISMVKLRFGSSQLNSLLCLWCRVCKKSLTKTFEKNFKVKTKVPKKVQSALLSKKLKLLRTSKSSVSTRKPVRLLS